MIMAKRKQPDLEQAPPSPAGHQKRPPGNGLHTSHRSLSADSISAFDLAADRSAKAANTLCSDTSSVRLLSGSRRHFQHIILSFATGVLVTYFVTTWFVHSNGSLPALAAAQMQLLAKVCLSQQAPGVSLSPMALSRGTGDPNATTDRLIVAARHDEVESHTSLVT